MKDHSEAGSDEHLLQALCLGWVAEIVPVDVSFCFSKHFDSLSLAQ
jgi:hypothetical protein